MTLKTGKITIQKSPAGVYPIYELIDSEITENGVCVITPAELESKTDTRNQMDFLATVEVGKVIIKGDEMELFNDTELNYILDTDGSSIGGGSATYSNSKPMPDDVGGLESGTTFNNKTMTQMWDGLLYPYQYPVFTSFTISGQNNTLEVGDSIPANVTFIWSTNNDSNINVNSINIDDVTNSINLISNTSNDGTEDITMSSSITKNTQDNHIFKISGVNSKSQTFTRNKTYNWNWRLYYGEDSNTTLDENGVESLRASMLTTTFSRTYSFEAGGYKYISYPTSFGTATSFKDTATNLDVPFEAPYTISITNTYGETTDYNVHRTTNEIGSSINIEVN